MTLRAAALPVRGSDRKAKPKRVVRKRAPAKRAPATAKPPGQPLVKRASKRTFDFDDAVVLIDYRRGSKELLTCAPFDRCGVESDLTSGDVCFVGNGPAGTVQVGVELKSLEDFISSTDNGRLQATQLKRMVKEYDVVWVLCYGRYRQAPRSDQLQLHKAGEWRNMYLGKRPVHYGMLAGLAIELQEIGVGWACVETKADAVDWLAQLVRWRSRPWKDHSALRVLDKSRQISKGRQDEGKGNDRRANRASLMPIMDDRIEMMANVASALPALGYWRAVAAAEHFTDVVSMVNASAEYWANLTTTDKATGKQRKFGKGVGDAVWQALRWKRSK